MTSTDTEPKFLSPHEVPQIPGTEGWEKLFPYYYQFSDDDPERAAFEENQLWFYDGLHYPEPHYPFDLIWDEAWFLSLSQNNTRTFLMPPALGIAHRIVNGYVYITPITVEDPEEVGRRVPVFMERAGYYYENWDRLYEDWKVRMKELIEQLDAVPFTPLPEVEDASLVFDSPDGIGSGYKLLTRYDDVINMGIMAWQYHMQFLNLGYAAYVTFINTANQIFPDIPISTLTKMVSGIDVVMYRPDAELIRLARLAIDSGLDSLFAGNPGADAVMAAMASTPAGTTWLAELEQARYPWFYISTGTGWYHHHFSWNDNLDVPFASIGMHIDAIKAGKQVGRPTQKLKEEAAELIEEYRSLIDDDVDRESFDQALAISQRVFPYVEDHLFYVEHWFHSIFWRKMRQVSDLLVGAGFFKEQDDIWYLRRGEVRDALWDLVTSWATGTIARGPSYWHNEIAWRREVHKKFQEWTPPPALGAVPDVVTEPFTIVLWGVTTSVLEFWLSSMQSQAASQVDLLRGAPGSSGVVEGPARVIRTVDELDLLQEGEILVATTTSPSWAPAFTKIAGAVTDVGGAMCHAAIVCREYGLPTVVGTGHGTSTIKTGDVVRIDGDEGLVTIVSRT